MQDFLVAICFLLSFMFFGTQAKGTLVDNQIHYEKSVIDVKNLDELYCQISTFLLSLANIIIVLIRNLKL